MITIDKFVDQATLVTSTLVISFKIMFTCPLSKLRGLFEKFHVVHRRVTERKTKQIMKGN